MKNRVRSYFTGSHNTKTERLVSEIEDFEYIVTESNIEAGLGVTMTTSTVSAQNSVSRDQLGVATSFNTLVQQLVKQLWFLFLVY